jgi:hypothetical protein
VVSTAAAKVNFFLLAVDATARTKKSLSVLAVNSPSADWRIGVCCAGGGVHGAQAARRFLQR